MCPGAVRDFQRIGRVIMKILVAKSKSSSEEPLEAMLEHWGYDPILFHDGEKVLDRIISDNTPDLVLLDRDLEDVDALNILKKVREQATPYPPYVILFDHDSLTEELVEGLEAGGDDFISEMDHKNEVRARIHVGERMIRLYRRLHEARDRLAQRATHDSLTGILNRDGILDRLRQELSRASRNSSGVGVGMCDIDHFKNINDTYGHQVGDQVLEGVVNCIRNNLREYDCVGRYGGEEFLIVTPDVTDETIDNVFSRLRKKVEQTAFSTDSDDVSLTVSFGIVCSSVGDEPDDLIAAADRALYRAKRNGRNKVCRANDERASIS